MARSLEARLTRLEHAAAERQMRRIYAVAAAEMGVDPEELRQECEAFLALPLAEQLAEVDRLEAALRAEGQTMPEVDEIKATLIRECKPR
jgi:hypothetical protein